MRINTVGKEFFEEKYRANGDPWSFSSSTYELNRYAEIIRILGKRRFDSGFEPGCSIGVLTEQLARHCEQLIAMDISPTAVASARERCAAYPNVAIVEGALPNDIPANIFDLIVFSEIGYYFEPPALAAVRDLLIERLTVKGVFVGVHWLGVSADHMLSGIAAHEILRSSSALRVTASLPHEGFLLESWERI